MSSKKAKERADERALHEAMLEALPAVRRFARGLTGSKADADDLLQSTVERTLARPRPEGLDVVKWMFRICRNLWIDELRFRGVRENPGGAQEEADEQPAADGTLVEKLAFEEVVQAMDSLSADQRAVLSLVAVEGMSYREAAEVLEIPTGTVMSRLARARAALAARFSEHEIASGGRKEIHDERQP